MESIYDGKLYVGGFQGIVYCYDTENGNLLWTYGNGGPGNSTNSGSETIWGYYPTFLGAFADGKLYTFTEEHSVNMPIYKGATTRCLNATTGEEIWVLPGFAESTSFYSRLGAIADGYLAYFNAYDGQVYCIGKGPSATTVSAPDAAAEFGTPVVIKGTVMDISAGTAQDEQAARFPGGVPAVSEASMTDWMSYVYQQKPLPTDVAGVEVTLSVIDSNSNCYDIGTVTTDARGFFHYTWTPEIPGDFAVFATFGGTNGYWPSQAETAFTVMDAPEATPMPTPTPAPMTDTYVLSLGIGAIIAIVAIGLVLILMLRKR